MPGEDTHALRAQLATALRDVEMWKMAKVNCAESNQRLRADVKRLRDLCRDVQGWMDEKHATAHFDGLAEKFRKATGRFPPGASRPMEMGAESEQEQEDNRARWLAFNQKALADVCDRIRAALATGGDRG